MSFMTSVRSIVFGVFFIAGLFSFSTDAHAAFSGSLYPDRTIAPGDSATLQAPMSGGTFPYVCTFSGTDGTNTSRTKANAQDAVTFSVSPNQTTTYTLSCTDNAGADFSDSATITVSSTPIISSFTATPSNELPDGGGSIQIKANIALATSCSHTGGTSQYRSDKPFPNGDTGAQYSPQYNITSTTTFSLECFNASGASSGKRSVTVFVGVSPTCGNGIVEKDKGEYCDLGTGNSNTCPVKCSTTCQSNGCDSVVDISIKASPSEYDPGESVKITWDAKNAVSCDAVNGEGFAHSTIGTSGSVTVKPTKKQQNYTIECYDSGGLSQTESAPVGLDMDYDLKIVSFSASPTPVPYGYTGDVTFSWNTTTEPADVIPQCSLGFENKSAMWMRKTPVIDGKKGTVALPVAQLSTNADGPVGTKKITLRCYLADGSRDGVLEYLDKVIYFQSDPTAAPQISLTVGRGSDRDLDGRGVPTGTSVKVYRGIAGADRCEFTDSRSGMVPLPAFVGEKVLTTVINEPTTFTLECWNGDLSSKKVSVVTIDDSVDTGSDQGPTGPTSSTTCATPGSTCQSGTFCTNGAQKVGSCNSGLRSCCMTGVIRGDGGGLPGGNDSTSSGGSYFNPLKFDSVEGVLTGVITQLRNIIVILSIIFIIIGAVMYILSAGNDSRMNTAKGAITAALIGLTLAIAAPAFLKEIASILGWTTITDASNTIQGAQTFTEIAARVLDFLLSIVGIIGIIMLVFGGFVYLTSAGDENKAESGKKIVTYAIIAIALALSALVLVTQVAKFFA